MRHIEKNCGVNEMGFIQRLEKNISKLEKRIEKERVRVSELEAKCDNKKITRAGLSIKKRQCDERIHAMNSRIRVLQGGIVREKQHIEERAEEKKRNLKKNKKRRKEN